MKKTRFPVVLLLICLMIMTACGTKANEIELSQDAVKLCGSWAYIHDKDTAIAVFQKDGTAKYNGVKGTFNSDSEFITFTDKKGNETKIRYRFDGEELYLFSTKVYTLAGGEPTGSIVGEWECKEQNWSFIFTDSGEFEEDGFFPGTYVADEEKHSFILYYHDHFENTECFYKLDGNQLIIEYPWHMYLMSK